MSAYDAPLCLARFKATSARSFISVVSEIEKPCIWIERTERLDYTRPVVDSCNWKRGGFLLRSALVFGQLIIKRCWRTKRSILSCRIKGHLHSKITQVAS